MFYHTFLYYYIHFSLVALSFRLCVCYQKTLVWLQDVEERLAAVGQVGTDCDTVIYQIDLVQVVVWPAKGQGCKRKILCMLDLPQDCRILIQFAVAFVLLQ